MDGDLVGRCALMPRLLYKLPRQGRAGDSEAKGYGERLVRVRQILLLSVFSHAVAPEEGLHSCSCQQILLPALWFSIFPEVHAARRNHCLTFFARLRG